MGQSLTFMSMNLLLHFLCHKNECLGGQQYFTSMNNAFSKSTNDDVGRIAVSREDKCVPGVQVYPSEIKLLSSPR